MAPALSKYNSLPKQRERESERRREGLTHPIRGGPKTFSPPFYFFLEYSVCVLYRFDPFVAPGGAGGARSGMRIVCMQTGRHGHCMRSGIYGGTDSSGDTARLKSQE